MISKPPSLTAPANINRPLTTVKLDSFAEPEADTESEPSRQKRSGYYNRRKKRRLEDAEKGKLDWDDTYDPMLPNRYEEYKQSEEKFAEDEDWRSYLLDMKARKEGRSGADEEEEEEQEEEREELEDMAKNRFAPPPTYENQNADLGNATISAEPIIYLQPDRTPPSVADQPRVKSAKETFAKRLLTKYGWTPGEGLGASSTGITKALHFSADKKKAGHGKILDKNVRRDEEGKFGKMSKVIKLHALVSIDEVDEELAGDIGQECDDKVSDFTLLRYYGY